MKIMHKKNIGHLIGHLVYGALYVVLLILAVAYYNSANLTALLYLGWAALASGIAFLLWASQSRKKVRMEGLGKESLVEGGIYALVRHPEFLGHILIISALAIISQHWISLTIGAILIILLLFAIAEEEKRNIEKFGSAYRDYMKRVPRLNLLIGLIRRMHSRKENKL